MLPRKTKENNLPKLKAFEPRKKPPQMVATKRSLNGPPKKRRPAFVYARIWLMNLWGCRSRPTERFFIALSLTAIASVIFTIFPFPPPTFEQDLKGPGDVLRDWAHNISKVAGCPLRLKKFLEWLIEISK